MRSPVPETLSGSGT